MLETDLYKRIEELELENRLLRAENKRLREALGLPLENVVSEKFIPEPIDCIKKEENKIDSSITKHSTPEEKIEQFLSLFRGRMDVYAKRCYSKKHGSSYYIPACKNES